MPKTIEAPAEQAIRERNLPDASLVPDIAAFIQRYVVLPSDEHATVLALWVLHTWTWEQFDATPYLYINSTEPQCGKTRLIEVLELLCRNPLRAASATPSALIRSIERMQPTLMLDEVDTVWRPGARNELLRGVINDGYKRGGSFLRIQQQEPKAFATFCPKVLAGIFNSYMPETIADRSIPVQLKRKDKHAQTEPFHASQIRHGLAYNSLLDRVAEQLERFADMLAIQRPEPITAISDRQWEITEPLMALASVFSVENARDAVVAMFAEQQATPTVQSALLENLRTMFGDRPKMFTAEIVESLGSGWTGKLLAGWLAPYGAAPKQIRIGNQTGSGYTADDLEAAWATL